MEVYLYFDIPGDELVMHFMGQPTETRHLAVRNDDGRNFSALEYPQRRRDERLPVRLGNGGGEPGFHGHGCGAAGRG